MKNFFLKKRDESEVTRLDPVTALEERLKSTQTIADPTERLLALNEFYNDCVTTNNIKDNISYLKKLGGAIFTGAAVGGIGFLFIGPVAVFAATSVTVVTFLGSLPFTNSTVKKLNALEKTAETLRDALIKTGDMKKMVESPLFDAAVLEFPQLKERFQLAAQKTAFLGQNQTKPDAQPPTPDTGFRF